MKGGSDSKPSVAALKDRFPHLKKLSQEAGRRKTEPESPVASLMSRFPDLSFLGVKKEAFLPREEMTDGSLSDQVLTEPVLKRREPLARLKESLSGGKESSHAQGKESSHAQIVETEKSCGPNLRPINPCKSGQDVSQPLKSPQEAGQDDSLPRKSVLGVPPAATRPFCPPPGPTKKVTAEDLFLSSVAMDDENWVQFQVEEKVPAKEQVAQLQLWLKQNRPSQLHRSQGFGWIAVMFHPKDKKVLEAKAAWEAYEGQKTMALVNSLATRFNVLGGKWMCHLPRDGVDLIWSRVGLALLAGGLGQHVYMVKVSPVEDLHPEQSRGEHVLVVYNTDYTNTEQVMRVESLLRSAGVFLPINYKPDIFSTLGIYRNNRWGFRPTIYSSRALVSEGRSRVETVGTGKWFYNSSRGLQFPMEAEKENVFLGLSPTDVVEDNHKSKPVSAEKVTSLEDVEDLPLGFDASYLKNLPVPPEKPKESVSHKTTVKTGYVKVKKDESTLKQEEKSANGTVPPADGGDVTKEPLKDTKENTIKIQLNKNMFVESSGKICSNSGVKKSTAEKSTIIERLTANNADSFEMSGTKNKTVGEVKTIMKEDLIQSEVMKRPQPTPAPVAPPRRVQPDWLAKLEELKMRSLDQF